MFLDTTSGIFELNNVADTICRKRYHVFLLELRSAVKGDQGALSSLPLPAISLFKFKKDECHLCKF